MVHAVRSVLVVDDDETIVSALSRGLRRVGKSVVGTTDPIHARRLARTGEIDLAIVDLRLGSASGIDLVRDLKRDHTEMKVVLISGYLNVPVAVEAMKSGATDVLHKPVTVTDILRRVESGAVSIQVDLGDTPSLDQVCYEHCARVVADSGGNVSKAARRLGVHRQSLQRWLKGPSPRE